MKWIYRQILSTCSLIILATTNSFSQTKLCEENSVMYSKCYSLDTNGKFIYEFMHCTGAAFGIGHYNKTQNILTFIFDSLESPKIYKYSKNELGEEIQIAFHHIVDGYPFEFANVNYSGQTFTTDSTGTVRINYSKGPIIVFMYFDKDSLIINPSIDASNSYDIYWHGAGDTFIEKGKKVIMKKRGKKYKLRERVLSYNEKRDKSYLKWRTTYFIEK